MKTKSLMIAGLLTATVVGLAGSAMAAEPGGSSPVTAERLAAAGTDAKDAGNWLMVNKTYDFEPLSRPSPTSRPTTSPA